MRESELVENIRNNHGEESLTRHGRWTKRWSHCGRKGMLNFCASGKEKDMPFNRCHEEEGYEQRLKILMRRWMDTEDENALDMHEVFEVNFSKVVLD